MSLNITIVESERNTGPRNVDVPADVAQDLKEVYEALAKLPSNRKATVDFTEAETDEENVAAARLFVRQASAWATENELTFARKGSAKENPTRVEFRLYKPNPDESRGRKPSTDKK